FCPTQKKQNVGESGSAGIMSDRKISERQSDKPVVHSGGEVFSDGSIVELIRIPNGELNFLIWNGKSEKTAGQFVRRGEIFAPLRVDPTILPWLQLPSKTKEFGPPASCSAKFPA
ncbi:MAG: hypothetical protein WA741_11340, partial [Candidatus Sulfotelmatobacter sp.]